MNARDELIELEGTGGRVWEYFVVTGGGIKEIEVDDVKKVESAGDKYLNSEKIDCFVESSDYAIDLLAVHYDDMFNVVVAEERRDRLVDYIGEEGWPKLSQHFIVTEEFVEKNYKTAWNSFKS